MMYRAGACALPAWITRHLKKSSSPANKIKTNSKTATLPALPKTITILPPPPPPPLKSVKKPDSWKDAGIVEVLGKEITSNETVTNYSATASTCSYKTFDKYALLDLSKCKRTVNEGGYINHITNLVPLCYAKHCHFYFQQSTTIKRQN